jgi:hypothetical protein
LTAATFFVENALSLFENTVSNWGIKMTEKEFIVHSFRKNFSKNKNDAIVIYGIGLNTKHIITECSDFNIIGLMDKDNAGDIMYGKKILCYNEVQTSSVKMIVVVARVISAKVIFERICDWCKEVGILLYDINGNDLFEYFNPKSIEDCGNPYFSLDEADLKAQITEHEVISFDVFDTLIMRKLLHPHDVFDIVGRKMQIAEFRVRRIEAELSLYREGYYPKLQDIYSRLQIDLNLSHDIAEKLMDLELQIEKEVLIPRNKMVEILNYALQLNKRVYLISDMYLPEDILQRILIDLNIDGYAGLLVSCEYDISKTSGMFDVFKQMVKAKSYLHIGDDCDADGICAQLNQIDSFLIKSAKEMLEISSYKDALKHIKTVNDRCLMGLFIANAFNDPFVLHDSFGRLNIKSNYDLSYLFIAPILTKFMVWFIKNVSKNQYNYIFFAARDGYLIQKLYNIALDSLGIHNMPKDIYFLTSRMCCVTASLQTEQAIMDSVIKYAFTFTPEELLKSRYGLSSNEILPYSIGKYADITQYVLNHKDIIISKSYENNANYLNYINSLGIKSDDKVCLFDLVSVGTCQYYLIDWLPCKIEGLYFLNFYVDRIKDKNLTINALFKYGPAHEIDTPIYENYSVIEGILTSFAPTLYGFNGQGEPVFSKETRSITDFDILKEMQQAILTYFSDFVNNYYDSGESISLKFAETLFSFMDRKNSNINFDHDSKLKIIDDFGFGQANAI